MCSLVRSLLRAVVVLSIDADVLNPFQLGCQTSGLPAIDCRLNITMRISPDAGSKINLPTNYTTDSELSN
jgi:hypothetical protein